MGKFLSSGFDPINEINVLKLQWGLLDALSKTGTRTELLQTGTEPCLSFQTIPVKNHKDLVFECIFPNFDPV